MIASYFAAMTPKKAEIENDIADSSDEIIIYERRNKLIDDFTGKITDPKENIQEKDDHQLSSICTSQNSESQFSITEEDKEEVEKIIKMIIMKIQKLNHHLLKKKE